MTHPANGDKHNHANSHKRNRGRRRMHSSIGLRPVRPKARCYLKKLILPPKKNLDQSK